MKNIELLFIPFLAAVVFGAFIVAVNTVSNASSSIIPCGYSRVGGKFNGVVLLSDKAIFLNDYHGSSTGVLYTLEGDVIEGNVGNQHPEHRAWLVDCIQKAN